MKLIYRGVSYEYDPSQIKSGNTGRPVRATQPFKGLYTLIYRGVTTEINPNKPAEVLPPAEYDLVYRGVAYHVERDEAGVTTATNKPAGLAKMRIPSTMPKQYIAKVHQANLMENLQRRLKVAQEKGDQTLVELLEAERRQIGANS